LDVSNKVIDMSDYNWIRGTDKLPDYGELIVYRYTFKLDDFVSAIRSVGTLSSSDADGHHFTSKNHISVDEKIVISKSSVTGTTMKKEQLGDFYWSHLYDAVTGKKIDKIGRLYEDLIDRHEKELNELVSRHKEEVSELESYSFIDIPTDWYHQIDEIIDNRVEEIKAEYDIRDDIRQYDMVTVVTNTKFNVNKGQVGTVTHVYTDHDAYEVEITTPLNNTTLRLSTEVITFNKGEIELRK
jgi:hypothetical protein